VFSIDKSKAGPDIGMKVMCKGSPIPT